MDWKSESFTLDPQWWKWQENGKIIDAKKSLLKRVSLAGITLYGTRSQIDLSTFDVYEDKVNSDVFLGAQPGHVLFESASAQPKQQQQSRTILREVADGALAMSHHPQRLKPGWTAGWHKRHQGRDRDGKSAATTEED